MTAMKIQSYFSARLFLLMAAGFVLTAGNAMTVADDIIPMAAPQTGTDVTSMSRTERAKLTALALTGDVSDELLVIVRDQMNRLQTLDLSATTMTCIPDFAFAGMNSLSDVVLPAGCTAIGKGAFMTCRLLQAINIPAGVTEIGRLAFADTGMKNFTIGAAVTALGSDVLFNCDNLETITVQEGNASYCIIDGALYSADKTRLIKLPAKAEGAVTFPAELKIIENHACYQCSGLRLPVFPEGLDSIGDYAFSNCSGMAGTLVLPSSLKSIGKGAFFSCTGLAGNISLPANALPCREYSFAYISKASSVTIPENCLSIPANTFEMCSSIKTITSLAPQPPVVGAMALRGIDRGIAYIEVADSVREAYREAAVWSEFGNYDAPVEEYNAFCTDGEYRIVYVGEGAANGKYLTFTSPDNAKALLTDDFELASKWQLEFFVNNHAAHPAKGNLASDIRFVEDGRCKHVNMAGLCWNDPLSGYGNNANRTFVFYVLDDDYAATEGPVTAIVGNGTIWTASADGKTLDAASFSGRQPPLGAFVWRIQPSSTASSVDIVNGTGVNGIEAVYDLMGNKVACHDALRGIHVVVRTDGSTDKVVF